MDSQESISFSMDTTSDTIYDDTPRTSTTATNNNQGISHKQIMVSKMPPDKSSSRLNPNFSETPPTSTSSSASSPNTRERAISRGIIKIDETNKLAGVMNAKKSVLFDTVTVYHFKRSQGFTTIPTQGGSTLGMKRKHFLRRKLSVDLHEEVRRRSRREILLKIRLERRKREEQIRRELQDECNALKDTSSSSSSSSPTTASSNQNTSDDDNDSSYSDYSDISDSELESDGYIFLQPISVKLRRSLLKASGVARIDPKEKKECNIIRDSRTRSGCRCVGQCIPDYCECTRLGVNCHVDRASYPCGCASTGCRNPMGRTEYDPARVKGHYVATVVKGRVMLDFSIESNPSNLSSASASSSSTASLDLMISQGTNNNEGDVDDTGYQTAKSETPGNSCSSSQLSGQSQQVMITHENNQSDDCDNQASANNQASVVETCR